MKKLPFCFGDFRPRDRHCNGTTQQPSCVVRDRCSAFQIMLQQDNEKREAHLKITPRYTYAQPELVRKLDLMIGTLGIRDGLRRLAATRKRSVALMDPNAKIDPEFLFYWFMRSLSLASKRQWADRRGVAENGQLFHEERINSYDVFCRVSEVDCDLICRVFLRTRFHVIDVETSPVIYDTFSKGERKLLNFKEDAGDLKIKGLERYGCSVVASRLGNAIDKGLLAKARS